MSFSLLQVLGIAFGSWVAWKVVKLVFEAPILSELPGPASDSHITGNTLKLFDKYGLKYHFHLAKTYGKSFRLHGFLQDTFLYTYDPKALYHIFIKDQLIFDETDDVLRTNRLMFGPGLISVSGDRHRIQRKILNPVFSAAHMREMTPIFYGVVHRLEKSLVKQIETGESEVDMLGWMTRTALELIGQSGFGFSFDTLEPDGPQHPFGPSLKNLFRATVTPALLVPRFLIFPYVYNIGSARFRRFIVDALSAVWNPLAVVRDMIDVMENTSVEILAATKDAVLSGKDMSSRVGGGKDLMSLLVKANMSASHEDKISDIELIAQVSTLTFAAMDTSSNALSSILHLLTLHPDIQTKLRQEVTEAYEAHGGDMDYDTITALPLLDAVIRETLRMFPPVTTLARQARKDVFLPLSTPIIAPDGKEISELFLPTGTNVLVSLILCNRDPDIWGPDSNEWKPERWLEPLPKSVAEARIPGVYSHLMTFIGGSRSCIGFKFAQLEMKVVLSVLLKTFEFSPSGKKVIWQMNGITQPTTAEAEVMPSGEKKLELPLKLSLVTA